ncbi:hypothetical protein K435DRAFT_271222 [Dendrothele bispora CBS 962.96]|uniref:Uncharacterized protein n=1 Tax=Dendrothele bispora (strain CBS 962.96) TaxID=1314807 RepID=A0A4S8LNQ4_DENBC|nr:hypothetical protein K435DRAFT_271222 [Dendrothele bispora CBS 962.96]
MGRRRQKWLDKLIIDRKQCSRGCMCSKVLDGLLYLHTCILFVYRDLDPAYIPWLCRIHCAVSGTTHIAVAVYSTYLPTYLHNLILDISIDSPELLLGTKKISDILSSIS